jgi:hypothetical protein
MILRSWIYSSALFLLSCGVSVPADIDTISTFGIKPETPLSEVDQLHMLVWNVHEMGDENFQEDFRELSKGKDLILLQEALNSSEAIQLFEERKKTAWVFAAAFYKDGETAAGVATGTTLPILDYEFQRSEFPEPTSRKPKMTLITSLDMGRNEPLIVVNFHGLVFRL